MRLRTTLILIMIVIAAALGCSNDEPTAPHYKDGMAGGWITLSLSFAQQDGASASAPAAQSLDFAMVQVYRPDGTPEVEKGVSIFGGGNVEVSIQCIAETNKKVSVALFDGGLMMNFGVHEGVNVSTQGTAQVAIDAWSIFVGGLVVNPQTVIKGQSFDISWDGAPAAEAYIVEESDTWDFINIWWGTETTQTSIRLTRDLGAHYFRVAPRNAYVMGSFTNPEFAYVATSSGGTPDPPDVSGMNVEEVPPGATVRLTGENLDYPATQVFVGGVPGDVLWASPWELEFVVPRGATTGFVRVSSDLGSVTYTGAVLQIQRIAYVSGNVDIQRADEYKRMIDELQDPIDWNTVLVMPVEELDWRDMSAFDLIIVGYDTGTDAFDWGANQPVRAQVIGGSGVPVMGIGLGGAICLMLIDEEFAQLTGFAEFQDHLWVEDAGAAIFNDPYPVPGAELGYIVFHTNPVMTLAFEIAAEPPPGMVLYASTDKGNGQYTLLEHIENVGLGVRHRFLWGFHNASPDALTTQGEDSFANAVIMLYNAAEKQTVPVASE